MIWIFLLLFSSFAYSQTPGLQRYPANGRLDFSGALNTKYSENLLPANQCYYCENVLFDETLGVKTRDGIVAVSSWPVAGITCQKIWSFEKSNGEKYFIGSFEDKLFYTITFNDWTLIRSGLSWQLNPIHAAIYNDKIFFTNGINYVFYFDGDTHSGKLYGEIELDSIKGKYICTHNNKLFIANFYDNASRIRYNTDGSDPTLTASWAENNYEDAGYEDGDIITGLVSYRDVLVIPKKCTIWGLFGYSYDNWQIQKINSDYGVSYQESIASDKGTIKFLTRKGVAEFNGASVKKIDYPVEDEFLNCNNLKGEYYYWQNTDSDDWAAGTSTGLDATSQELSLADETKVWNSSVTFSSGILSNVETIGENLQLKSNRTVNDSVLDMSISLIRAESQMTSDSSENFDFDYDNEYRITDNNLLTSAFLNFANLTYLQQTYGFRARIPYYETTDKYNEIIYTLELSTVVVVTELNYKFNWRTHIKDLTLKTGKTFSDTDEYTTYCKVFYQYYDDTNGWSDYSEASKNVLTYLGQDLSFDSYGTNNERANSYDKEKIIEKTLDIFTVKPISRFRFKIRCGNENDAGNNNKLEYIDTQNKIDNFFQIRLKKDFNPTVTYQSTGTLTSEIHDFSNLVYLSTFTASVSNYTSQGTSVTFKMKTSSWSATLAGESWTDINGDVGSGVQIPSALSPCRYVQVFSSFSTTQSSHTPKLQSITIGATKSTGTWTSKKFNAGKVTGGWKYYVTSDIKNGQTINYFVKTATGSTALDNASWDSVSSGDLLSAVSHPSTHTWYQTKAEFSTTDGRKNPTLESITQTYCPVSVPIVPASASIEDRYYISISTGGFSNNRLTRVYDKRGNWTQFTGWQPVDFTKFGNDWYMAESDNIYKMTGTTDNGTAITSVWKKYFDMGLSDIDKQLEYVYITGKQGSGTLDFQYKLENSTTTYTVPIEQSGTGIFSHRTGIKALSGVRGFYETITSTNAIEVQNLQNYFTTENLR